MTDNQRVPLLRVPTAADVIRGATGDNWLLEQKVNYR